MLGGYGGYVGGAVGAGAITSGDLAAASVLSGNVGSGQIGSFHLADGTVLQVDIASGAVTSGNIASGQVGGFHYASGSIVGYAIGTTQSHIASGSLSSPDLCDGAIGSGNIASGHVCSDHLASGLKPLLLTSANVHALREGTNPQLLHLYETYTDDNNFGRLSINYLAAQWRLQTEEAGTGENRGLQCNFAEYSFQSPAGGHWLDANGSGVKITETHVGPRQAFQANCEQAVSGLIAVAWGSGGCFVVPAERASGLRSKVVGVVLGTHASGAEVTVIQNGFVRPSFSGGIASGFPGRLLYLGSGGLVINQSGFMDGASSGHGAAPTVHTSGHSGVMVVPVGVAISGGLYVQIGEARSGLLSGELGQW